MRGKGSVFGLGLLLGLAWPTGAWAGNGTKPRTPPIWPADTSCRLHVDRGVDAQVHFDYAVAFDDVVPPDVTDEVPDSRTHQFFALCRQRDPREELPRWITADDVAAAEAFDLLQDGDGGPETILESNPEWSDCFWRITPDDARVPITVAQAEMGFDWDTSAMPIGHYLIYGYTWEPWVNIWTLRPGLITVADGSGFDDLPPAAAMVGPREEGTDTLIYRDQVVELEACAAAMPGSTWSVEYLVLQNGGEGEWVEYAAPLPLEGESLSFDFVPPEPSWGESSVFVRLRVRDPMGREFTAPTYVEFAVLNQDEPQCGEGGFVANPGCGEGEGETDAGESGGTEADASGGAGDTGTGADTPTPTGCACAADRPAPAPLWLLLLASPWLWRRREIPCAGPRQVDSEPGPREV